jgi:hypothetical protein
MRLAYPTIHFMATVKIFKDAGSAATVELFKSAGLRCFMKIDQPVGMEILCQEGQAWVTQDGDRRDYFLGPGEAMRFTRAGKVLVSSLGSCTCAVRDPDGHAILLAIERR